MIAISIDGKRYEVEEGQNLLQACQTLGLELPYFCWHPAMGSVGSCRQCAVILYMNNEDTRGRLTMSCMTPVSDGMRLSLEDPKAKDFRKQLIEATMTSHPHDCPVCEEGGECHLQDMTLISGHTERRFRGPKRTHVNQYLGPFISHEMNRCIGCYRCVRFYRDYAGGTDLNVFASRNNIYFGRAEDGTLESDFSGNLVEVCPTGVFTDKTFSIKFCRKWELQSAPSICTLCCVGCHIQPGERDGKLRRITSRFNPVINGHFICDLGRFGNDYVNHPERTAHPWQRNTDQRCTDRLNHEQAADKLKTLLQASRGTSGKSSLLAIGSSRSSLENNFALRELVGVDNYYSDCHQATHLSLRQLRHHYQQHPSLATSLKKLEAADAALVIGEDVSQTAPMIALSLRQMSKNAGIAKAAKIGVQYWSAAEVQNIAQDLKSPIHIIHAQGSKLDDLASSTSLLEENRQLELIEQITTLLNDSEAASAASDSVASLIAKDLRDAKRPVIVTGINHGSAALCHATLALSVALYRIKPDSGLVCAVPQANSLGVSLLSNPQQHLSAAFDRLEQAPPKTLIILETDLYRYCETERLESLLDKVETIVVLDHLLTPTGEQADLLLPTTSFAEYHGSWVNYEGRLQAAMSCFSPNEERLPAYHWLTNGTGFHTLLKDLSGLDDSLGDLAALHPQQTGAFRIARKSLRASGRTAIHAAVEVREQPPALDKDSAYSYSQEGVQNPAIIATSSDASSEIAPVQIWSPGWNSSESLVHFQRQANGPIIGEQAGLMLFRDNGINAETDTDTDTEIPASNEQVASSVSLPENGIILAPCHQLFTDEEQSSYVDCIREKSASPAIRLNSRQAEKMGFAQTPKLAIHFDGNRAGTASVILPLHIDDSIVDNLALIPAGLYRIQTQNKGQPAWACLEKHHE